jgi:hypothetical protein
LGAFDVKMTFMVGAVVAAGPLVLSRKKRAALKGDMVGAVSLFKAARPGRKSIMILETTWWGLWLFPGSLTFDKKNERL